MKIYLSTHDQCKSVVINVQMEKGGMVKNLHCLVYPGEDFCGIPFDQLRAKAESGGEIEMMSEPEKL